MKNLIAFIESHGFRAKANDDGSVSFSIPFAFSNEVETHTVRTHNEARIALGY
jgi:hypothetical protein